MLGPAAVLSVLALAPSALLARYQPVTVLHPAEPFAPVAVEGFLSDSELQALTPAGWETRPKPATLPTTSATSWRLNHRCSAASGVASIACYAASEAERRPPSVVYGAVRSAGDRIALQYWYWYSYDFWDGTFPATDDVWQAHEGDWEAVTVVLTRKGDPLFVGVTEHQCGKRRVWRAVPRWHGTHPVVHVALGSHAGSFHARPWPVDLRPQRAGIVRELRRQHRRDEPRYVDGERALRGATVEQRAGGDEPGYVGDVDQRTVPVERKRVVEVLRGLGIDREGELFAQVDAAVILSGTDMAEGQSLGPVRIGHGSRPLAFLHE